MDHSKPVPGLAPKTRPASVAPAPDSPAFRTPPTTAQLPASHRATSNEEGKQGKGEKIKSGLIKGSIASLKMNPNTRRTVELVEMCKSVMGADEMARCHDRWLGRAEAKPDKLVSVLGEVKDMIARGDIKTTPAKAAEDLLKRWTP